jgi:hypothetical protein|tara:strand:+ start:409 stop:663 length:255 start_codon:yes stop_codon:yes gene_type:complete
MSDYRNIILAALFLFSLGGCVHSVYIHEKSKIIKQLNSIENKTPLTKKLIQEYKHFFEFKPWHWVSWGVFVGSAIGIIIDSYRN